MKETGQLLKKTRLEKDISLEKVASTLKIAVRTLKAIEENDQSKLPAQVFLRGFVHSYARYLQADVEQVLKLFHRETTAEPSDSEDIGEHEANLTDHSEPTKTPQEHIGKQASKKMRYVWAIDYSKWSLATRAAGIMVVAVLISLIYFVLQIVEKYEREAVVRADNTVSAPLAHDLNRQQPEVALEDESDAVDESSQAEEATEVAANNEEVSESPTDIVAVAEEPLEEAIATDSGASESTEVAAPAEQTSDDKVAQTKSPASQTDQISAGSQEVIVEAFDSVELTYSLDGESLVSVELTPGDMYTMKAEAQIELQISDGGIVNIFHNGNDEGVPGQIGTNLEVSFP